MEKTGIPDVDLEKLLSDKRVIAEIERHLWIESEKAGENIGYEKAQEDWLERFSRAWMEYHMPEELLKAKKVAVTKIVAEKVEEKIQKNQESAIVSSVKRRRAKSYFEMKK